MSQKLGLIAIAAVLIALASAVLLLASPAWRAPWWRMACLASVRSWTPAKVRARLPAVVVCVRVLVDLQARPIQL